MLYFAIFCLFRRSFLLKDKHKEGTVTRANEFAQEKNGFSIEVNGKEIEANLKPGAEVNFFTAMRRSYLVQANENGIFVKFYSKNGEAFLSGIRLRKL